MSRENNPPRLTCIMISLALLLLSGFTLSMFAAPEQTPRFQTQHVLHISVDGLHPQALSVLSVDQIPNFRRLCMIEGTYTANARTDPMLANTLPNHVSQVTGRSVFGEAGHGWFINADIKRLATLHQMKKSYIASVFDVAHDSGLSTAIYASKSKFSILDFSWNQDHGAPDLDANDNGRDKVDRYQHHDDIEQLTTSFLTDMQRRRYNYTFLHFREPDSTGHQFNWDLSADSHYLRAVQQVDRQLGRIIDLITREPLLAKRTTLILTSDHSGELGRDNHLLINEAGLVDSGIVPFCVWGAGVQAGADLYALNPHTRLEPGRTIPSMSAAIQPIRNGDAANLALSLLSLPPVPGSNINSKQDLATDKVESTPWYAEIW